MIVKWVTIAKSITQVMTINTTLRNRSSPLAKVLENNAELRPTFLSLSVRISIVRIVMKSTVLWKTREIQYYINRDK